MNVKLHARGLARAIWRPTSGRLVAAAVLGLVSVLTPLSPQAAQAGQQWRIQVGAQSRNQGIQALKFYPEEIWINAGDNIVFNFATGEQHTVTFGMPTNPNGYPGPPFLWARETTGAENSLPSATGYVNSGLRTHEKPPFTVSFTAVGDFAYRCLIHRNQTGTVHVQAANTAYRYDQAAYDRQANPAQNQLLARGRQLRADGLRDAQRGVGQDQAKVIAGTGDGDVAVDRFLPEEIRIREDRRLSDESRHRDAAHGHRRAPGQQRVPRRDAVPGPELPPSGTR